MSGVGHEGRRHRHAPAAGRCLESAARRWSALHRPGQPGRGLLAVKHPIREVLPAVGVERLDDAERLVPPPGLRHAVEGGRADVVHGVDHDERGRLVALVDVDDRRVEATATSLCSCAASICASRSALSRARREFGWTCSLRRFLLDAAGDDQPQSFRCVQSKDFENVYQSVTPEPAGDDELVEISPREGYVSSSSARNTTAAPLPRPAGVPKSRKVLVVPGGRTPGSAPRSRRPAISFYNLLVGISTLRRRSLRL